MIDFVLQTLAMGTEIRNIRFYTMYINIVCEQLRLVNGIYIYIHNKSEYETSHLLKHICRANF